MRTSGFGGAKRRAPPAAGNAPVLIVTIGRLSVMTESGVSQAPSGTRVARWSGKPIPTPNSSTSRTRQSSYPYNRFRVVDGDGGNRTLYPQIPNLMLYQLSYIND